MKTIGTLEEIGAQVGDVVEYYRCGIPGGHRAIASNTPNSDGWWVSADGDGMAQDSPYWRIITKAAKSPVRTVTRKEIVPGVYGAVGVQEGNLINVAYMRTVDDLTAAIETLTEIRDAMQDNT